MGTIKTLLNQFSLYNAMQFYLFKVARKFTNSHANVSYSQTGEDIIIQTILQTINKGLYVEVGSNEPIQHSNTFGLYLKGWRGITIDANKKMVELHKRVRPNDIAICAAVSDEETEVTFYEFEMDEISTINKDFYLKEKDKRKISKQTKIKTRTLDNILNEYSIQDSSIDLLSIDVEGHDFKVLKSINLTKYRPKLIVVEMHDFNFDSISSSDVCQWMLNHNYSLVGYATWNGYFKANEFTSA